MAAAIPEPLHSAEERERMLAQMQSVKDGFYAAAVRIGNHPFLEFAGVLHEYIEACRTAHFAGIDFTQCNAHSGVNLPLHGHQVDYINEKLSCIFTGRSVMNPAG